MKKIFKDLMGVIFLSVLLLSCGGHTNNRNNTETDFEYEDGASSYGADPSSYDDDDYDDDDGTHESGGGYYDNSGYNNDIYNGGGYVDEPYESPKSWYPCRACNGTGNCRLCGGIGQIQEMSLISKEYEIRTCPNCHGSGICGGCDGVGGAEH